MEICSRKLFTESIIVALVLGLSFFGLFKYFDRQQSLLSAEIERAHNENVTLQERLNKAEQQEKEMEKIAKTDRELLQKYSKVYFLNEHYIPSSISTLPPAYINPNGGHFQVHTGVLPYLEKMIDAGNVEGMHLQVVSGYRSFKDQRILKAGYVFIYGAGTANQFSADQGYSEHQLGTTVDFTTLKLNGALEGFDKTPEYKWILENAHKYGFVISYPAGNSYYKFEPWHWRFVGVDLATRLYEDKINFYKMDQRVIDKYLANIFD